MRQTSIVLLSAVIALVSGFVAATLSPNAVSSTVEPVYDRVMRTQTIRCGYIEWAPWYYKDQDGNLTGLGKETTDQILSLLDLKVVYVPVSIGNQALDLKTGKIDSYCFDSPNVLSWLKAIDYSTPYYNFPIYVYSSTRLGQITDITKLNEKSSRFIGFDGDLSSDLAKLLFPQSTRSSLPGTSDPSQPFLEITNNHADYFIVDKPTFAKYDRNNPGKIHLAYEQPLAVYPVAFSVVKGEGKLLRTLSAASEIAINMGIPERILSKYDVEGGILPAKKAF